MDKALTFSGRIIRLTILQKIVSAMKTNGRHSRTGSALRIDRRLMNIYVLYDYIITIPVFIVPPRSTDHESFNANSASAIMDRFNSMDKYMIPPNIYGRRLNIFP